MHTTRPKITLIIQRQEDNEENVLDDNQSIDQSINQSIIFTTIYLSPSRGYAKPVGILTIICVPSSQILALIS